MACRVVEPAALALMLAGVDRVQVTDAEVADAMALLYECTHNVAEGAGAAAVAPTREAGRIAGRRVGVLGAWIGRYLRGCKTVIIRRPGRRLQDIHSSATGILAPWHCMS
jgi:hypothetical protein